MNSRGLFDASSNHSRNYEYVLSESLQISKEKRVNILFYVARVSVISCSLIGGLLPSSLSLIKFSVLIFSGCELYIGGSQHNKVLIEVNELGYYLTDDISPSHRSFIGTIERNTGHKI